MNIPTFIKIFSQLAVLVTDCEDKINNLNNLISEINDIPEDLFYDLSAITALYKTIDRIIGVMYNNLDLNAIINSVKEEK